MFILNILLPDNRSMSLFSAALFDIILAKQKNKGGNTTAPVGTFEHFLPYYFVSVVYKKLLGKIYLAASFFNRRNSRLRSRINGNLNLTGNSTACKQANAVQFF